MTTIRQISGNWLLLALVLVTSQVGAEPGALPQYDSQLHLGVATCAGSACHGATQPFQDSTVEQNEFVIWHQQDKHSQAYKVLLDDRSKKIATNLGLESAHTAKMCLDCHADNIPAAQRGKRFQLSDGVGCEACHGGAENWLGGHVSGQSSHQDNIESGMYPTDEPAARGTLCLSCHLGNKDRFVTHQIMGAGHPRLSFELDTFTAVEPAHFTVDTDYVERKHKPNNTQVWAIGQVMAVELFLDTLIQFNHDQTGIFPELSFFDCHACHHSMKEPRWNPRATSGLAPGTVRLNDANIVILNSLLQTRWPSAATQLKALSRNLHAATAKGMESARAAAERMRAILPDIFRELRAHEFTPADSRAIALTLITDGLNHEMSDYGAAEQCAMALSATLSSLEAAGSIDADTLQRVSAALDAIYLSLQDEDAYRPENFLAALSEYRTALTGN
jgi:hypothetical protein